MKKLLALVFCAVLCPSASGERLPDSPFLPAAKVEVVKSEVPQKAITQEELDRLAREAIRNAQPPPAVSPVVVAGNPDSPWINAIIAALVALGVPTAVVSWLQQNAIKELKVQHDKNAEKIAVLPASSLASLSNEDLMAEFRRRFPQKG